jgi:hypothetical protein
MRGFVSSIQQAAHGSKESLNHTMHSTGDMNEKLDAVSGMIKENTLMLQDTVKEVHKVAESLQNVKASTGEVNQAMNSSAQDAEKLLNMTQVIHADANQSAESAKRISKIDEELTAIARDMSTALTGGMHAISNEELTVTLERAKEAHSNWLKNLTRIVEEMKVYPIQTNSRRCAFGHFYHSIEVSHPDITTDWHAIDVVHEKFHSIGTAVLDTVKRGNAPEARSLLAQAQGLSQQIFTHIDKTISGIAKNSHLGVEVMQVSAD